MKDRLIKKGDKVICLETGVIGTVLSFYAPTSCEEQTKVLTHDGRHYHAPTRLWHPYSDGVEANLSYDGIVMTSVVPSVVPTIDYKAPPLAEYQAQLMHEIYGNFLVRKKGESQNSTSNKDFINFCNAFSPEPLLEYQEIMANELFEIYKEKGEIKNGK